jgi:cell wall assembly regulator SMI1
MSLARLCLRCGTPLERQPTGRPRHYCGDACRQAGNRLRAQFGEEWWHTQPWYPAWQAERDARREQRTAEKAAGEAARARERALLDSMPPDVRAGAEATKRQQMDRQLRQFALAALRLQIDALSMEYEKYLAGEGMAVQLVPASQGKVSKLLWRAVSTDSEHEAAAMLAKARDLVAAGEATGAPGADVSPAELLRRFAASMA